ncbi:MAG TPA: SH3 domain-containing protein [Anaerolineae bacterium]
MKSQILRTSFAAVALTLALSTASLPQMAAASSNNKVVVTSPSAVTVIVDALNVRAAPSLQGDIIGSLSSGTKVAPTGQSTDGQWWKITYNGQDAYIFAQYAVEGGAATAATTTTASTTGPGTVTVTSEFLNVRAGPGLDQAIIGRLASGDSARPTGQSSDGVWWQITYSGQVAYIYAAYTTSGGTGTTTSTTPPTTAAPAAPPSGNVGNFGVGGHIHTFDYLPQMKSIGMTWVKFQAVLPGDIGGAQNVINTAHSQGMKALIGAKGDLSRAGDANYHNEFAGYLATLAKSGADAIEVWNEPNLDREYGGSGHGQVNPENYVDMLQKAYNAIRAANGGTMVVGGANAPTGYFGGNCSSNGCDDDQFLARMAAAGAANYMDCMGAHHNGSMVGPDTTSGAPTGNHYSWYFWGTLGMTYNSFGGKVPICWTELGYVTGEGIGALPGGFSWGSATTLDNQAQWLARAVQLSRESGKVKMMIIWNIDFRQFNDDPQAGFSIFRPNGDCRACATIKAAMGL